ncbi:ATP-binding protein [Gehongia tenuis]|uniref:AAA family ATPase n=1 Tax=Gehongia tenuis TaxID=2763655 RepID=A0A926D5X1_9FIRM|nr:ATP-binding protein [Gehongia tenuis]MBC8531984.1 AAA family ATPase [Gehongia tenuis]
MIRKAQRLKAKLRLGISGPAGSGKTMGALLVAHGICKDWSKICLIDTENGSGDLYANYAHQGIAIGEYNIIDILAPYTPEKYLNALKECEQAGMEVVIIDSLTHAWAGTGGLLDKKGQIEKSNKNGWAAWREITPLHNRLVDTIIHSGCHIIATFRAKMDYVQEVVNGKTAIRKVGMAPIQRDGMEYEFSVFVEVDQSHQAIATKDRTSLLDGRVFELSESIGQELAEWLESGEEPPKCEECGSHIRPTSKSTVEELIQYGREHYAAQLCVGCMKKRLEASKSESA